MAEDKGNIFEGATFNIIKSRGDPKVAVTLSGHTVTKQNEVYCKSPFDTESWVSIKCADYHNEHFIYVDPVYNMDSDKGGKGHWFAMCTCGSPAVIVGMREGEVHETGLEENLLVCYHYTATLLQYGHGWHQGQDKRVWEK